MNAIKNIFFFGAGIAFLGLAKLKHSLRSYSTPKPFPVDQIDRCIDYDVHIVNHWFESGADIEHKRILELGPGSDFGVGLYLLARGAAAYYAVDRNALAASVPDGFYERFRERYGTAMPDEVKDRLHYHVREDFDISAVLPPDCIDLVLSNAAFEHFDDVPSTVRHLSNVVRSGGTIIAGIDLQTHSRWIRDVDPMNIYRYPAWLYRLFHFPGQPNRVRPGEYRRAFETNGWTGVTTMPASTFEQPVRVHRRFRDDSDLGQLSIVLKATRS